VFDHYGDIVSADASPEGLYHEDTRYLSDLGVLVNRRRPLLLSSTVQDNNAVLTADLTNPDIFVDGVLDLPRDTIQIVRSKFLWQSASYERFGIRNFDSLAQPVEVGFHFAADFADIFEVRGYKRERRGKTDRKVSERGVALIYHGLDGIERRSIIRFDPKPEHIDQSAALFRLNRSPLRLLDIGGDKLPPFLRLPSEPDPALGRRGIRMLRDHPQLLTCQLRSFLRIAAIHDVRILIPMVTLAHDIQWIKKMAFEASRDLGLDKLPPVGAMIEIPAVVRGSAFPVLLAARLLLVVVRRQAEVRDRANGGSESIGEY
jgi:N-terminal domain of (some) glycogen debranching enzymes/PEP-utilising enzyme, PEP-binding domain